MNDASGSEQVADDRASREDAAVEVDPAVEADPRRSGGGDGDRTVVTRDLERPGEDDGPDPELDDKLSHHLRMMLECTIPSDRYGRILLATPPGTRYPYVYPRDSSCACQTLSRLAGSRVGYSCADDAYDLLRSTAEFMCDAQAEDGSWGQRYSVGGANKSIYRQEDNVAHGVAILCNFLLTARRREREVKELENYLEKIDRALSYALENLYHSELNLFESTTAIHESTLEQGYTLWTNFAYLYAYTLACDVCTWVDGDGGDGRAEIISEDHLDFLRQFERAVSELFLTGNRYARRMDPTGNFDLRPDVTLLSPFYFGFGHYERQQQASVQYLEKQLWDPELGMVMRYLPFRQDFSTHVHAGNGPWLQYTAILAQYHFYQGNQKRGDELLEMIDRHTTENDEIPEHLSTCERFENFMEKEWRTGLDFAKEFDDEILLDDLSFDLILEEANNMQRSYEATGKLCRYDDEAAPEGGYIQFATPLMWSHAEYARALLQRAGDWWRLRWRTKRPEAPHRPFR